MERLRKALGDKAAPMAVACTRLENRTERPGVELCRDAVSGRKGRGGEGGEGVRERRSRAWKKTRVGRERRRGTHDAAFGGWGNGRA